MKTYIIIMGHGNYASGIYSSLRMLAGSKEELIAIDFLETESEENFSKKVSDIIPIASNLVFCCDLMGGTPYKVASRITVTNPDVRVLTGINLGGLLDTSFKLNNLSLDEIQDNLINASHKNILALNLNQNINEEIKDGI